VDQMVRWLRQEGQTVGVLAVDPSSPYTGGALLGDRIRMQGVSEDEGVYIRSMLRAERWRPAAGRGRCVRGDGGAGRQTILIETVGVGQDEVEVIGLADVTVVVLVAGMGDEVQSLKAGVMEVADIFVVNKSDAGGAERVESEVLRCRGLPGAPGAWMPPVVRTVATSGEGVAELMEAVRLCAVQKQRTGKRPVQRREGSGLRWIILELPCAESLRLEGSTGAGFGGEP